MIGRGAGRTMTAVALSVGFGLLVVGCSYTIDMVMRNESGQALTLMAGDGSHAIPSGGSVRVMFTMLDPRFRLVTSSGGWEYEGIRYPPKEGYQKLILGGLGRAVSYLRIRPDGRIEVLRVDKRGRVLGTGPQPEGYPLVPIQSQGPKPEKL